MKDGKTRLLLQQTGSQRDRLSISKMAIDDDERPEAGAIGATERLDELPEEIRDEIDLTASGDRGITGMTSPIDEVCGLLTPPGNSLTSSPQGHLYLSPRVQVPVPQCGA